MDVQLQELIEKIRKDGVESATTSAGNIIDDAQKKAAAIIKEAEEKADSIIRNAKAETARMEKASEDAITQAGRNLIISFRDGINRELSALVSAETEKAYDKDLLKKLIPETVKAWTADTDADDLAVLLSPKDLKALQTTFKTSLKTKISKGLVIKGDDSLTGGFRIGSNKGNAFYDFSSEEVASLFSAYLNPKVTELMKAAAAGVEPEVLSSGGIGAKEAAEVLAEDVVEKVSKVAASAKKSLTSARKTAAKKISAAVEKVKK